MTAVAPLLALIALLLVPHRDQSPPVERHLVYTRDVGLRTQAIWIADADGRRPRRLVRGQMGLVSPDGTLVAFERASNDLYVVSSDGSGARLLAHETLLVDWFPDAQRLLVLRGRSLLAFDVATGQTTLIRRNVGWRTLYGWSFSADGGSLTFAAAARTSRSGICGDQIDVHAVDLVTGVARRVTRDGRSAYPVWGDDFIAFSRIPADCFAVGIWRARPDGSGVAAIVARAPRRFSRFGYYGLRPYAWFPGGRKLVAGIRTEWGDEAAVIDVAARSIRRLNVFVEDVSADARFVIGTQGGAEFPFTVAIASTSGARPRVIAQGRVCCAGWNR